MLFAVTGQFATKLRDFSPSLIYDFYSNVVSLFIMNSMKIVYIIYLHDLTSALTREHPQAFLYFQVL